MITEADKQRIKDLENKKGPYTQEDKLFLMDYALKETEETRKAMYEGLPSDAEIDAMIAEQEATNKAKEFGNSLNNTPAANAATSLDISSQLNNLFGDGSSGGGGGNDAGQFGGGNKIENKEFRYFVIIQFDGQDQNLYDDVLFLNVFRPAFIKSSSYYYLRVNVTSILIEQLKQERNANKVITAKLMIYTADTEKEAKAKELVFQRKVVVSYFKPVTSTQIERSNQTMIDLILFNPTVYAMDITYAYNVIHKLKTPYDILKDYEGFITKTYGDNFETKHITNKLNTYKYPQILTHPTDQDYKFPNRQKFTFFCKNDIDIPLFLQYKYKIDNVFGFYFYDDFNMRSKKEIVRYFITFYDKNKFEKFVIKDETDIMQQSQYAGSFSFADMDKMLSLDNTVITNKLINSEYSTGKTQISSSPKGMTQANQQVKVSAGGTTNRYFYGQQTAESVQIKSPSNNYRTFQIPDTTGNTSARVSLANELFQKKIEKVDMFSTNNCSFEWLQFGMLYAMNPAKPDDYLHTPISIVNMFHRLNNKEQVLTHTVRYMMLKFKKEEESSGGGSGDGDSKKTPAEKLVENAKKGATSPAKSAADKAVEKAKKAVDTAKTQDPSGVTQDMYDKYASMASTEAGKNAVSGTGAKNDTPSANTTSTPKPVNDPFAKIRDTAIFDEMGRDNGTYADTSIKAIKGPITNKPTSGSVFEKYASGAQEGKFTVKEINNNNNNNDDDDGLPPFGC